DVVRELYRLGLVLERDDRDDRPEDLLLGHAHRVVHLREHRRRIEGAVAVERVAAGYYLDAFLAAGLDEAVHLVAVRLRDERAHLRLLVERVAGLHPARRLREAVDDRVVERLLDEDPRARVAALAGRVVDRIDGARDRGVEVGVGEEDVRALTAELERDALHRLGAKPHDLRARPRRAREGDLVHAG